MPTARTFTEEEDALLAQLGVEAETRAEPNHTPEQERVIAGFEEIRHFVSEHGHLPGHGEDRDIFERLYAVRLERIRGQADLRALVEPFDHQGLLAMGPRRTKKHWMMMPSWRNLGWTGTPLPSPA